MRIGLIAMSGIRACDEELLQLGLTLPGFVERSKTIASLPSLGLLTLAGMTPACHEVDYIEMPEVVPAEELPLDYDLIGISTYSAQIFEAYQLADMYRKCGIPVVMGGPHVTVLPDEALAHCDAVAIGEGEACWPEILTDAENHRLKSTYGSRNSDYRLDNAPTPAFDKLDMNHYNRLTVQTSRGCPHQCSFCASSTVLSNRYKQKPVDKVLTEIERIFELWSHPFIEFADDNSFVNKDYWKELLGRLQNRHMRWFTETDLTVAQDSELLHLMRRSGCAQVLIGLENPGPQALDGVELRSNWKQRMWPHYKDAIREIQSHGITVNGCFILGLDGQTPDIFDCLYDFVLETELYEVQITLLTAFPGTPLYEKFKAEDRILQPNQWQKCTLFDINFQPRDMTVDELSQGFKKLAMKLYSDEFTQWRRNQFKKNLRHQN